MSATSQHASRCEVYRCDYILGSTRCQQLAAAVGPVSNCDLRNSKISLSGYIHARRSWTSQKADVEFRVPYSQRYLVLGLVGLALWLVSGIALSTVVNSILNSLFAFSEYYG